jgi:hypothetical protein
MKSISKVLVLACVLALAQGCTKTIYVDKPTFENIAIPDSLLVCPYIKQSDFPPLDATNKQLIDFIDKLFRNNNLRCAPNMAAVKEYIAKRNAQINEANKTVIK